MSNIDKKTVDSFGKEWSRFDQTKMLNHEVIKNFNDYFDIFPWHSFDSSSEGFDMGCGSGRWAALVAPKVGKLTCIDPSDAILIAKKNLEKYHNVEFIRASVSDDVLKEGSQDFGYSLGVLHHIPNTLSAIKSCVSLLKPGAPLLLYLYYNFDNRSYLYKIIWRLSDLMRRIISRLPSTIKNIITDLIAITIYFPLAKLAKLIGYLGLDSSFIPLSYYKDRSLYTMRTDSRDRFGTPLEQRFTRKEIKGMLIESGLNNVRFSDTRPYLCVIGFKK